MSKQPLNIVFFPHSVNYGLAGTNRLQNIIYYLWKDGVTSISNIALEDSEKLYYKKGTEPFLKNYKEIYYGPSLFIFIRHIFQTLLALSKFKKKACKNVIFFYGEVDIKNFFFVLWARLIGYRIVIDVVEDLETFTKFTSFKNRVKYRSAVFFRKRLNRFADAFTVVSVHLQKKITGYFPDTPIFFLPVTINKNIFSEASPGSKNNLPGIFYSGSFNGKDGLPFLLKALHDVKAGGKNFRFVLTGKGSDAEMKQFWNNVDQLGLREQINYKGFLNREEYVYQLTHEADVLCMTRINSAYANAGFPFKLGEFLATGKPVIASKVSDVTSYINETDAYLVEPENSDQITAALTHILDDHSAAEQTGRNGKMAAMKYFDHELYASGLKTFLEEA